jgi:hypothetical protein
MPLKSFYHVTVLEVLRGFDMNLYGVFLKLIASVSQLLNIFRWLIFFVQRTYKRLEISIYRIKSFDLYTFLELKRYLQQGILD